MTTSSPPLPSLKGLHALVAIARHGSVSAAAAAIGVSRSALSHRVAELERQLGVSLLRPMGRGVVLTDDAQTLLAGMGDAIDRIDAAVAPLRRRRAELRLSTVATLASLWLIPRLGAFRTAHPDIALSVSTTQRIVDLGSEDFDCAIRHGFGGWDGLEATLLFHETLVPVAAPGVARDVVGAPPIRARSRFADWAAWWRATARSDQPAPDGLIVETRAQAMDAALAGAGVALLDRAYIGAAIGAGRLVALGPVVDLPSGYWFVHRPHPRNARLVRSLGAWLVAQAHG